MQRRTWMDYAFCYTIGVVYIYALIRTVFSATIIRDETNMSIIIGIFAITFFLFAFYNRITRIIFASVVIIYVIVVLRAASYPEFHYANHHMLEQLVNIYRMVSGQAPQHAGLTHAAMQMLTALFSAVVVLFMFHKFNFWVLTLGIFAVFALTWIPNFTRDQTGFLLALFVFCVILIRKMNDSKVSTVLMVAPLCALAVILANANLPQQSNMFVRRSINETFTSAGETISDSIFALFNPTHFSFQTTGFSGPGGRLGGPVTLNNRAVMDVVAPGRTYLSGASSNTFTGYSWISTLEEGAVYTHGLTPGGFESLETIAAMIRNGTLVHDRGTISTITLWDVMPPVDARQVTFSDFNAIGITVGDYYLHTYIPASTVTITMGRNRSGTIFRPLNTMGLTFATDSMRYLPQVQVLPSGDMQTPRLMSRNTEYIFRFLNVDTNREFMAYIMRLAGEGIHAGRVDSAPYVRFGQQQRFPIYMLELLVSGVATLSQGHLAIDLYDILDRLEDEEYWRERLSTHAIQVGDLFQYVYYLTDGDTTPDLASIIAQWPQPAIERSYNGLRMIIFYDYDMIVVFDEDSPSQILIQPIIPSRQPVEEVHEGSRITFSPGLQLPISDANPWHDSRILPEVAALGNYAQFGVAEMMLLANIFTNPQQSVIYIPSEAYLIRWLDAFSRNVLADYAQQVRANFLHVPEITPPRVHNLTMQIIEGQTNDFDRVMAIRDFLLQFPYTLNVVPVPQGVCFVDHFLFETREGYCTYFASAMAIMARIAGVPSRYVEGFVLPPSATMQEVTITNRMAHAWVEVYLEGFGWLIVEATPTYAFLTDPAASDLREWAGGGLTDEELMYLMMESMREEDYHFGDWWGQTGDGNAAATTEEEQTVMFTTRQVFTILLAIPAAVILGIIIFLISRRLQLLYRLKRIHRLSNNQKVVVYFGGILNIVTYYTDHPLKIGETAKDYGVYKGKRFAYSSDSVFFRDLIALYYKAKYSHHQMTDAECKVMEDAYFDMVNLLRSKRWKPIFIYLRYVNKVGALDV